MRKVQKRRRAVAAVGVTVALIGGTLAASVPAAAAPGSVSGMVFLDFDGNGVFDTGNSGSSGIPNDAPLAGISVTATDALGALIGAAVTGADGTYSIDTSAVDDGTALRIEFSDVTSGEYDGFHGPDSGTSVQFVVAGDENFDFSVVNPAFYSSPDLAGDVPLVQAIQRGSNRSATNGGSAANIHQPSLVSIPWNVPDNRGNDVPASWTARTTLALTPQTGALGGTAFDREGADLYAAAQLRRFADLGPAGLGGIYIIEDVLSPSGELIPPTLPANPTQPSDVPALPFIDVTALGVDVGQSAPDLAPVGGLDPLSAELRGLGDSSINPAIHTAQDPLGYTWTGRAGIGGIAVSSDSSLLYFVNLYDSRLYAITLPDPTVPGSAPALAGSWDLGIDPATEQASAVTVYDGAVFVGVVGTGGALDAALPGAVPTAGTATATGDMRVLRATESTGSLPTGAAWSEVLSRSLADDYPRGVPIVRAGETAASVPDRFKVWHNWTNQWDVPTFTVLAAGPGRAGAGISWSQPILSDVAFTSDGRMVLTLADRFAMQNGVYNWAPVGAPADLFYAYAQGDILYATPEFVLENDGTLPGLVTGWTNTSNLPTQGLGGGEFFDDNVNQAGWRHDENGLGWAATFPGVDQVAAAAYDPVDPNLDVAGVRFVSASGGVNERGFIQTTNERGFFQKAGGLGAVTLLLAAAPVEIGNRVWLDADLNGRQDPDEPAINGAPVTLFAADATGAPSGAALATTVTDAIDGAPGTYYFHSLSTPGLTVDADYVIVFGKGAGAVELVGENAAHPGFAGLDWADLEFTLQNSVAASVTTDSNPDPVSGEAPISVGGPGENDHTIDAGFVAFGAFDVEKLIDPAGGTPTDGQTFTIDVTSATNFRGQDMMQIGADYLYPDAGAPWVPAWEHDWTVEPASFSFRAEGGVMTPLATGTPQRLPIGYQLRLEEVGTAGGVTDVVYSPADATGSAAEVLITAGTSSPAAVTVTNTLTDVPIDPLPEKPLPEKPLPPEPIPPGPLPPSGSTVPWTILAAGLLSVLLGASILGWRGVRHRNISSRRAPKW